MQLKYVLINIVIMLFCFNKLKLFYILIQTSQTDKHLCKKTKNGNANVLI